MAAVTPAALSGSTDGQGIKVAATETPGTLIHTADATALDFLGLEVVNTTAAEVTLTLEWGGVATPDNLISYTIPAKGTAGSDGTFLISSGRRYLTNSKVLRAFASAANALVIYGSIDRIV